MLERVRARDEVDRLCREAGLPRVERRAVVDPETRLEGLEPLNVGSTQVAQRPSGLGLDLGPEPRVTRDGVVDELELETRADIDEELMVDTEGVVAKGGNQIPACPELVEDGVARLPIAMLFKRSEVLQCTGHLLTERAVALRQAPGHVALQEVIEVLAVGDSAQGLLGRGLDNPLHGGALLRSVDTGMASIPAVLSRGSSALNCCSLRRIDRLVPHCGNGARARAAWRDRSGLCLH